MMLHMQQLFVMGKCVILFFLNIFMHLSNTYTPGCMPMISYGKGKQLLVAESTTWHVEIAQGDLLSSLRKLLK